MTQVQTTNGQSAGNPRPRQKIQRRILAGIVVLCGFAIVTVLLSDPRVTSRLTAGSGKIADMIAQSRYFGPKQDILEEAKAQFQFAPTGEARVLPLRALEIKTSPSLPASFNQVRVRRAGILASD